MCNVLLWLLLYLCSLFTFIFCFLLLLIISQSLCFLFFCISWWSWWLVSVMCWFCCVKSLSFLLDHVFHTKKKNHFCNSVSTWRSNLTINEHLHLNDWILLSVEVFVWIINFGLNLNYIQCGPCPFSLHIWVMLKRFWDIFLDWFLSILGVRERVSALWNE